MLSISRGEGVGGSSSVLTIQRLEKGTDRAGLHNHLLVETGWSNFQLSKTVDGGENEVVDFVGNREPSAHGQLLPNGDIGVSAVDGHLDGSNTDSWVLSLVQRNRHEKRKDLVLNKIVGDWVAFNTVDFVLVIVSVDITVAVLNGIIFFVGADEVLEGVNSLGLFLDII